MSYGQEQGITILNNAIKACTEEIDRQKGKLVVKEAPRAVSINFIINNIMFDCLLFSFTSPWNFSPLRS